MITGLYDMHCHFLPGVDDGASDMEEAIWLIKKEYDEGVRNIILTPHYRRHMFETDRRQVRESYLRLLEEAQHFFPELALFLGCECHTQHDLVDVIRTDDAYRMGGTYKILLEFSEHDERGKIRDRTHDLIAQGYEPVLAHIDRYEAFYVHKDLAQELKDMGAELQVNADSILGYEGRASKHFAKTLIKKNLLDYIGSDGHDRKDRVPHIGECADYLTRKMGEDYARRIMCENPRRLHISRD